LPRWAGDHRNQAFALLSMYLPAASLFQSESSSALRACEGTKATTREMRNARCPGRHVTERHPLGVSAQAFTAEGRLGSGGTSGKLWRSDMTCLTFLFSGLWKWRAPWAGAC